MPLQYKVFLEVPYYSQPTDATCYPTAIKMVMHYYEESFNMVKLYSKAKWPHGGTSEMANAILASQGYKIHVYFNGSVDAWTFWAAKKKWATKFIKKQIARAKYHGAKYKTNATLATIRNYLRNGIPVIAEVLASEFYNTEENFTHTIVINGFDAKGFHILDPYIKSKRKISYKKFSDAWFSFNGVGRSIIVILPPK